MYIRSFKDGDKQIFLQLCKSFYSLNATSRDYDENIAEKTFQQVISKHENLWGYFLVENDTEDIFGYALVTSYWCNEDGGNIIILDELYIDPKSRNKGYAKKCMEWIENEFKNDAVAITLEVLETNFIAKDLYAKEGFEKDGYEILTKKLKK